MADLDENIIRRSLPFGVDTSIGAVETHASENLILHDSEICDYSDRLLGGNYKEAGTPEGIFRYRRMLVGRLSDRTPEGMLRYHYIQGDKLRDRHRALRLT